MVKPAMTIEYRNDLAEIDWRALKAARCRSIRNWRSLEQLQQIFQNSYAACIAWFNRDIVGTARVLSDGVCNAYLVDVWTLSSFLRIHDVDDQWVGRGPALCREYLRHSLRIGCISAEAVNGLRGEGHQSAVPQNFNGLANLRALLAGHRP
jgi:hypothetical protein